jgi:hypothetical protein
MKTNCITWFVLAFWPLSSPGQTNAAPGTLQWVTTPKLELRLPALKPRSAEERPGEQLQKGFRLRTGASDGPSVPALVLRASSVTNAVVLAAAPLTASLSLEGAATPSEMAFARRLVEEGELTRIQPPSQNRFLRPIEAIFRPTPVRLGKLRVSCSILTAIKRRNPLCLLNPFFIQGGW